jgi:DNA modification methylase
MRIESQSLIKERIKTFCFGSVDLFGNSSQETLTEYIDIEGCTIPKFTNEFWTSRQRQADSIHEISYRACFKPQLPRFFIELLTKLKDVVYDPFSGRGTTGIEAGLLNRNVVANDINPYNICLSGNLLWV